MIAPLETRPEILWVQRSRPVHDAHSSYLGIRQVDADRPCVDTNANVKQLLRYSI